MREHRHLTRWRLIYYLRVFDRATGALLGHVVDMTVEGLMLVSAEPVALDRDYHVRMALPPTASDSGEVELTLRALWRGTDTNEDFHDTGFRLVDPSEDTILRVQEIIEELRFPGGGDSMLVQALAASGTPPPDAA